MSALTCPNDHPAVIRNDPKGMGHIAQCDTCGWAAPFVVARERAVYEPDPDHELGHNDDPHRKQLPPAHDQDEEGTAAPAARRRADRS